jgi:hypothetical protein
MPGAVRTSAACVFVIAAALALSAGSPALAADPLVTVDDPAPSVEEVDGGGYKLSVGLTNITGDPVEVMIDETSPPLTDGCAVEVDGDTTASVPAASHRDVELTFDSGCVADDVNSVVLGAGPEATQKLTLKPKDPEKPTPDWDQLWAFAVALGGAAVAVIVLAFLWNVSPRRRRCRGSDHRARGGGPPSHAQEQPLHGRRPPRRFGDDSRRGVRRATSWSRWGCC